MKQALKNTFNNIKYPLVATFKPRQFHAFCVGNPKSGTHSIANIFQPHFRSEHEPFSQELIEAMLAVKENQLDRTHLKELFLRREKKCYLEMESSHLLNYFALHLAQIFPLAKFILTVRSPISWLSSMVHEQLLCKDITPANYSSWQKAFDIYFNRKQCEYSEEERILEKNNLYPLSNYFQYWQSSNYNIINNIPKERLLIINTTEISDRIHDIAQFLEIDPSLLNVSNSHAYKASSKRKILEQIPKDFIKTKLDSIRSSDTQNLLPIDSA